MIPEIMRNNVLKIIFSPATQLKDTIQFSFGKQISLKHLNSCNSSHIHSSGVVTPIAET